ncbi:MAG: hypothetical protein UZ22_OP11002000208 [Microgenomates bacterium OLB23]|nr:MAG: hypothetical protein UZ22_OP11002000208 [Microgenomates bacterium OLB23]
MQLLVHLKNLRADLYINEFSLTFPKNFISGSIQARDSGGQLDFVRQDIATGMKITFKFDEPTAQKGEHFITITYELKDLFTTHGTMTEAILPLVQPDENSIINVELKLPATFDTALSLSKPIPSSISGTTIKWENSKVRTIYAMFGPSQVYKARLTYNLENTTVFSRTQQVAFPPDTLYQKNVY